MNKQIEIFPTQSPSAEGLGNSLEEYIAICRRRWMLIVGLAMGSAILAATWSYLQTPIFQAKATVVIEREGSGPLDKDKYSSQDVTPEYFQTHFELMKSRQVLQRTADLLELSKQQEFQPQPSPLKDAVKSVVSEEVLSLFKKEEVSQAGNEEKEDVLLSNFSQQIEIMPIRGARLAHITVRSKDPKFAARAANTLASVYIDGARELNTAAKGQAAQWFTRQLEDARKKVEASQQALYAFRSKHGLLGGPEQQAVASHKLTELNTELLKSEIEKAKAKTRHEQIEIVIRKQADGTINEANLDTSTEALSSPLIQNLRAQEIRVSGQLAELSDKYGPLHPKMARAQAELQDLRNRIQQEIQKVYDSVKREYDGAVARERAIKEAVNRHKQEKVKLEQFEIESGILEREAESNQHLYEIFLKVTKEADLTSGIKSSNVYLADPAVPSSIPVKPKKKLNTMLGLLGGLMAGIGLAFFLEHRDQSLKGPSDVERYLPAVSLIGMVPLLSKREATKGRLLPSTNPLGPAAESFRTIRTSLLLSNPSHLPSCVLITSPGVNEGKTTLAVNLSTSMAQLEDTRVVVVDADLRKPDAHPIFEVHNGDGQPKGLADFLAGRAEIEEIIYQTEIANLSVIPSGRRPTNPSELLHSKQMAILLNWCQQEGFHIVVDAPPVLPVTDAVVLAGKVDGILMVVSEGKTTREASRIAIQNLTAAGGKILGIVLQKSKVHPIPYYYSASSANGSARQLNGPPSSSSV